MAKLTQSELIKQRITEEYIKCKKDCSYFLSKYAYIQHPKRGKVKFDLYTFQVTALDDIQNNKNAIILKCRQMGISTLIAGYAMWLMLFHNDKSILVLAIKQDTAKNIIKKVRYMNQALPSWLKMNTPEDNKLSLAFSNGSSIKATTSSGEAGRSEALSLLIFDEAAFIDDIESIWTAARPTLSHGGQCVAISTPNGVGNWFHKKYIQAESGDDLEWVFLKLHWTLHPEYDQAWRDGMEKELGSKEAAQECDCSFLASGHSVIEMDLINFYKDTFVKEPIERRGLGGDYWLWEQPPAQTGNLDKSYMIVADVARGDSTDYSTFHVIDLEASTQVAEYRGRPDTSTFGYMLVSACIEWNEALLVIEREQQGWAVIQRVIDQQYQNLFYISKDLKYVDTERMLTNKLNREERGMIPGFSTNTLTRPLIISKLDLYMRDHSIIIHSQRLIDELFTFIWFNGKAQAMRSYNDDLVMPMAIGLWVRDTALRLRQEGIELSKKIMDGIRLGSTTNAAVYSTNSQMEDPYIIKMGNEDEDLRWLLG